MNRDDRKAVHFIMPPDTLPLCEITVCKGMRVTEDLQLASCDACQGVAHRLFEDIIKADAAADASTGRSVESGASAPLSTAPRSTAADINTGHTAALIAHYANELLLDELCYLCVSLGIRIGKLPHDQHQVAAEAVAWAIKEGTAGV